VRFFILQKKVNVRYKGTPGNQNHNVVEMKYSHTYGASTIVGNRLWIIGGQHLNGIFQQKYKNTTKCKIL
jgi:hypothetical protein